MAKQATDTFVVTLADGTEHRVTRGEVLHDGHAIVRHAPSLFSEFDTGSSEKPASRGRKAAS